LLSCKRKIKKALGPTQIMKKQHVNMVNRLDPLFIGGIK
jgi:hypothetical protein